MEAKHWMCIFIAFIMIFSIFGFVVDFAVQPNVQTLKYNDVKFKLVNQQYFATIDGVERAFVFFPGDLEFIELSDDVRSKLSAPVLAVTYDQNSSVAENFGEAQYYFEVQLENVRVIERALINAEGTQLPEKSCADATEVQPVVELRLADSSGVSVENNCIIVSALDAYDLYQQVERVVYHVLGVMG